MNDNLRIAKRNFDGVYILLNSGDEEQLSLACFHAEQG